MDSLGGTLPTRGFLTTLLSCKKKSLRVITLADFHAHTKPIMKETNILSLTDQRHLQVASLMWDLDHDSLPPFLSSYFKKSNTVHQHNTRHAANGKFLIPKTNTAKHGRNSFQVQGSLTLNGLKDLDIYKNYISKKSFLNNLKKSLINNY